MNTKQFLMLILAGAMTLAPAVAQEVEPQIVEPAPADEREITGDPAEEFLKAYMQVQKAETLEREGQLQKALVLYRGASTLINGIVTRFPTWQPLIVEYRSRRIAEAIASLKQRLGSVADEILARTEQVVGAPVVQTNASAPLTTPGVGAGDGTGISPDPLLKQLQDRMWALQQKLADSEQTRQELENRLGSTTGQMREIAKRLEKSEDTQRTLRERLAILESGSGGSAAGVETQPVASGDVQAEIASLRQQLAAVSTDRDNALALTNELTQKLETTSKERDDAVTKMAQFAELETKYQTALKENADLAKRIEEVKDGATAIANKDEEITKLMAEIGKLKDDMAVAQRQNADYEATVTEMQTQLDDTSAQLTQFKLKGVSPAEIDRIATENTLLRGIVTKQLQSQARRDQARRVMLEQLTKYQAQTDEFKEQLDLLGEPLLDVDQKEKDQLAALLKEPVIRISEETAEPDLEVSVAATKPGGEENSGPATAESGTVTTGTSPATASGTGVPTIETSEGPSSAPEYVELAKEAKAAFDAENFREAERLYEKILTKSPNSLFALSNLGVVYFRMKRFKSAEMMLKKAVELDTKDAFSYQTLGIVYYQQEKFDESMEALTRALDLNPRNAIAHNYLGITASRKGWPEAAEKEILEAIALNPDYADAHFNLAVVYAMNEPPSAELARRHYKKAVELGAPPDEILEKMLKE